MDTMLKCEVEGCCMWKVGGMHQKKCEVEELYVEGGWCALEKGQTTLE